MPRRASIDSAEAEQDDSLVVHPATQFADADVDPEAADNASETDEEGGVDSQGFWEAEAILDETRSQYLIAWKGVDGKGNRWKPTWEPKENANEQLITSWKTTGRAKRKADRKRKLEEKAAQKAAKRAAKEAGRKRLSASSTNSPSISAAPSRNVSVEVEIPVERSNTKRKMVIPSSDGPAPTRPKPLKKKARLASPAPPVKAKQQVTFDVVIDDDEEEPVVEQAQQKVDPVEEAPVASSGSSAASVIPDSQAVPVATLANAVVVRFDSAGEPSPPAAMTLQLRSHTAMHSPATSQSDLEPHTHADGDDDVPIFDPLRREDCSSSPQLITRRQFGPVPVPPISAFNVPEETVIRSSQFDPIEDPDLSPHRSPLRRQQPCRLNDGTSPRPRPAKSRLELVAADEDETPVFSFEAEVQSAVAASYVSLPLNDAPIVQAFARAGGAFRGRQVVTRPSIVKHPVGRAPSPARYAGEAPDGDGIVAAARAAVRLPSPEAEDVEMVVATQDDDLGGAAQEFFDEIFDYDQGVAMTQQAARVNGKEPAKEAAADAGEGYPPTNGGGHYQQQSYSHQPSNSASGSQQHQQQPQQQSGGSPGYVYGGPSRGAAVPGGYGYGSVPTLPGGGYPSVLAPLQGCPQQHQQPPKRELEDEAEAASKKARLDHHQQQQQQQQQQPQQQYAQSSANRQQAHTSPYPAAAHAHSPYSAMPQSLSSVPPPVASIPSPYGAYHQPQQQHPAYPQHQPSARPPALNVQSPTPSAPAPPPALASPSLARVQNADAYIAPSPQRAAQPLSSPRGAIVGSAVRSPSPLPPPAANVIASAVPAVQAAAGGSYVSRNSSPAPGGAKVDEVIALVRQSPHIVSDGTKEEIEKFLREPMAYSANPTAPLLRLEFWAFELRRHNFEGVEKIDFIILRSLEGTFQLKRAAAGNIPVEFARSLSHTSTRTRGFTPAMEAVTTLATSVPPPPPPAQMSREQLEQEVERLRSQYQVAQTELATLKPLADEVAKLKTEVQMLTKQNKSLTNSRESAQADLSYMQAQYQAASSAAVERANECRVAEAEVSRLKGVLETGVQQKALFYESQLKALKAENGRLKKERTFLKEGSQRTQERRIHEKAAMWDNHLAEMKLKEKEEARKRAGEPVEGDSDEEEMKVDQHDVSSMATVIDASTAIGPSQLPSHVAADSLGLDGPVDILEPTHPMSATPETTLSTRTSATCGFSAPSLISAVEYRCEWRVGTSESQPVQCGAARWTKEELQDHVLMEHVRM
ncbi:chromo domain-like containing protein [Rhodotorula toruloides]|uniref:Chromo domain-like containing protein n=1 Tax=Rhodotorula toruloides TaxID=5286 RepID=A0A511KEP1_RHOTO|nr:chromo domain-like containing protein [Rhodotorula toruloides]